jgi:D-alanine-D-alanine ligase
MKKTIAIIRGGNSLEKTISLKSADVVYKCLNKDKYNAYLVDIESDNWHITINGDNYNINKNDFSATINNTKISFDGVFMAIHGSPGEDGILQGYFDMLKIPYNCSGVFESSLTFNKAMCNRLLKECDVKTADAIILTKNEHYNINQIESKLGLPCIVKPNRAGSSYGISKVTQSHEWKHAINVAFKHDNDIIVESFINGTEVTCGVIRVDDHLLALPLTEIVSTNDFFDFEAKYHGKAEEITPARINENLTKQIQKETKRIYELLHLKGMVRVDYIIEDDTPFLIEINTVPGLSEESIIPKQARALGISLEELFNLSLEQMFRDD